MRAEDEILSEFERTRNLLTGRVGWLLEHETPEEITRFARSKQYDSIWRRGEMAGRCRALAWVLGEIDTLDITK
jgi:hypothetical protein